MMSSIYKYLGIGLVSVSALTLTLPAAADSRDYRRDTHYSKAGHGHDRYAREHRHDRHHHYHHAYKSYKHYQHQYRPRAYCPLPPRHYRGGHYGHRYGSGYSYSTHQPGYYLRFDYYGR